ncbi:MAG: HpcH/HpaI aldolase/citrate lyase family protein [Methanobacteriota archaeon]
MRWRPRRSVLFTPGTRTDRWRKALGGPADVAVADLEDAVPPSEKASARKAVAEALSSAPAGTTERAVRINAWPGEWAQGDVDWIAPRSPDLVVVPKVESVDAVRSLEAALRAHGCQAGLLLLFETARGVLDAPALAAASSHVRAVAFGAEDYAASVGARRTAEGLEVLWARSRVVAAAAAAGVDAIDQVFVGIDDAEGLETDARFGARLGYRGKQVIHPKQVEVVHRALRPSDAEVAWAHAVVAAAGDAKEAGVVVVEGRMIDRPLILQAERVLAMASLR